jgi:hypothetical protein
MTRTRTGMLLLVLALAPLAAARSAEIHLEQRIDLNVTDADAGKLFQTLGQLTGARIDLEPQFQAARSISIRLDNVTVATALNAVCESIGCRWRLKDGAIVIGPMRARERRESRAGDLEARIDLRVTDTDLHGVMQAMAQILGVELEYDDALAKAKISLDMGDQSIAAVLDAACAPSGCKWKLLTGAKPVLQVAAH